jgi:hypothetical protein
MEISFENIWMVCTSNKRVVPKDWDKLYKMLKNKKQNSNGSWTPSLPLILAAWHHTTPIEKQLRFKEHIQWACDNNQLEEIKNYLRKLNENEWFHFGEI